MLLVLAILVFLNQVLYMAKQIKHRGKYFEYWVSENGIKGTITATGSPKEAMHLINSICSAFVRALIMVLIPTSAYAIIPVALFASSHIINIRWYFDNAELMITDNIVPPRWFTILTIVQAVVTIVYLGGWVFINHIRPLLGG